MSKIDYLKIFKDAWSITWSNRYLWWFGLLIALTSCGGSFNLPSSEKDLPDRTLERVWEYISVHLEIFILGLIAFFALLFILIVLGIIARSGLILSLSEINQGRSMSFRNGMKQGKSFFWKMVGLRLLLSASLFSLIIVLSLPTIFLFVSKSYIGGLILLICALVILFPLFFLSFFLGLFGNFYIVLGRLSAWASIENAYALLRKNIGASLIMLLLFVPLGIIFWLAVILGLIPFAIIFLAIGAVGYFIIGKTTAFIVGAIASVLFLAIVLLLSSIYQTFVRAAWFFFFRTIASTPKEELIAETAPALETSVTPDPA